MVVERVKGLQRNPRGGCRRVEDVSKRIQRILRKENEIFFCPTLLLIVVVSVVLLVVVVDLFVVRLLDVAMKLNVSKEREKERKGRLLTFDIK